MLKEFLLMECNVCREKLTLWGGGGFLDLFAFPLVHRYFVFLLLDVLQK